MAGELILIAEDDDSLSILLDYSVRQAGFESVVVHDGKSALETAIERGPAVCLLDVNMPELDGYEVLAALRADARTANTKVLFVSGHDNESDVAAAKAAGADDYVVKPFTPEQLVGAIKRNLD